MKNAQKVCRSVKRVGGEEVHHIPHIWVNSNRESGFSRGRTLLHEVAQVLGCETPRVRMHPLNLGQFSKPMRFSLDTNWIP